MHREMPIGAAIALLKKEIADRQSALSVLEGLVAQGVSSSEIPQTNGATVKRGRKPKLSIGKAAVAILKAGGRPMHGLREVLPALEAQGYKIKHRAGLATVILRTHQAKRTAPGTFVFTGGAPDAH